MRGNAWQPSSKSEQVGVDPSTGVSSPIALFKQVGVDPSTGVSSPIALFQEGGQEQPESQGTSFA